MKNNFIKISLLLSLITFMVACTNTDDVTGDSTQNAATPNLSVSLDFTNNQTFVEEELSYGFTVSLSAPQIVDVSVKLEQVGGTATEGDDFSFPHSVRIPAGSTSVSDVISIHADELAEETETVSIKITNGTEANVGTISGETVNFTILNYTEGDLAVGLSWDLGTTITDNYGNEIDPYSAADLRLLITDVPYTTILGGADGFGAESLVFLSTAPDGEYYMVADFYDAMDDIPTDINLTLTFDQAGVINNQTHTFAGALNTSNSCSSVYFIMAKVIKNGSTWTFEEVGENSPVNASPFIGTATVVADDWADYAPGETITIEAGANPQEFWIRAYTNPYIGNGATAYMIVTIDPLTGGATVSVNEYFDYGVPVDIQGSGSVNACAGLIELSLDFIRPSDGAFYASGDAFVLQL